MNRIARDIIYSILKKGNYLEVEMGNFNLLLTAPHGGGMKPIGIPNRKYGNRSQDTYTRRLTNSVKASYYKRLPYSMYADIHRQKIDLNREIKEAAQGNTEMERVWRDWNTILYVMSHEIINKYGKGLYVDIHSQNINDLVHIGYGLSAKAYNDIRGKWKSDENSTLDSIVGNNNRYDVLFGEYSFVDSFNKFGYPVIIPINDKSYLSGGRNIRDFSGYGIGAVQVELPISLLKRDFNGLAQALSDSIRLFMERFIE